MDEFEGLLALLAAAVVLCGPVALVVSLAALKRIRELQNQLARIKAEPPMDRHAGDRLGLTPIFPAATGVGSSAPIEAVSTASAVRKAVRTVGASLASTTALLRPAQMYVR
jgi:hypothetical protein